MKRKLRSIKSRILFFFIGLAIFQICVMAGFAKLHLEPSIEKMYSEHLSQSAGVTLDETVAETKKIEKYMVNIIGDMSIQNFLTEANLHKEESVPSLSTNLRNQILAYTDYDNSIQGIYLIDNYGRIYSNLGKGKMQKFLDENPKLITRKDAKALWYVNESTDTIAVYRIINNNTTNLTEKKGALCVFINKKLFQERIEQLMMEEGQHYILKTVDRNFKIVSEENEISDGDIISVQEKERFELKTWIDRDTAYEPVKVMIRILMIELLILLVISVGLIVYLSERITRPIKKIQKAMKEIGAGNMDISIQDEDEDEMGMLAATLNKMSQNIKELMEKLRKDEDQKRYLELKAMQYQINPHFLYNTLDSIVMSARKNNDQESEKMTMALSDFFRFSLSQGMEYVSVETEMRYVQAYMEIQKMRFPDSVSFRWSIEPGLEEIKILKFILQPLVENSLYHGIQDAGRNGEIVVCAYKQEEKLCIRVSDNGIGMRTEELEYLRMIIMEKQNIEKNIRRGGFGIQNVQQRLKLVYGEQAGLTIESEWDEGTSITIIIPEIIK